MTPRLRNLLFFWGFTLASAIATVTILSAADKYYADAETWEDGAAAVKERPAADWPTYSNERYGFEIKYPKQWYADEIRDGGALYIAFQGPGESTRVTGAEETFVAIAFYTEEADSAAAIKAFFAPRAAKAGQAKLNRYGALSVTVERPESGAAEEYFAVRNANRIILLPKADKEGKTMLSTFRFVGKDVGIAQ